MKSNPLDTIFIFHRLQSRCLLELPVEMRNVVKTAIQRDLQYRLVRRSEQALGTLDAFQPDIFPRRQTVEFLEDCAEIGAAHARLLRQLIQRQRGGQIFIYVIER